MKICFVLVILASVAGLLVAVGPAHASGCRLVVNGDLRIRTAPWGDTVRIAHSGESHDILTTQLDGNGQQWAQTAEGWSATFTVAGHVEGVCPGATESQQQVPQAQPVGGEATISLYDAQGLILSTSIAQICPMTEAGDTWNTNNAWNSACRLQLLEYPGNHLTNCLAIAGHSVYDPRPAPGYRSGVFAPLLARVPTTAVVVLGGTTYTYTLSGRYSEANSVNPTLHCSANNGMFLQYSIPGVDSLKYVQYGYPQ